MGKNNIRVHVRMCMYEMIHYRLWVLAWEVESDVYVAQT